ncbi:MAG: hypothetical protein JWO22_1475, partial [Frankiales bacterium]|nr:hypothetical protein [Frankiales bacterium]
PDADYFVTRAITVRTRANGVWPWIAQIGQQRGGFYSYDVLENLVGCQIHSAERIHLEWQATHVGDEVRLHPKGGLAVAELIPGTALALHGGVAMGRRPLPFDFSWAFVLTDGPAGTCRLLVRERYSYGRRWAAMVVRPTAVISALMTRRMLIGIRDRAERVPVRRTRRAPVGLAGAP